MSAITVRGGGCGCGGVGGLGVVLWLVVLRGVVGRTGVVGCKIKTLLSSSGVGIGCNGGSGIEVVAV